MSKRKYQLVCRTNKDVFVEGYFTREIDAYTGEMIEGGYTWKEVQKEMTDHYIHLSERCRELAEKWKRVEENDYWTDGNLQLELKL